jgi:hypothetical protein
MPTNNDFANAAKKSLKSPSGMALGLVAGTCVVGYMYFNSGNDNNSKNSNKSLEEQFGTADGQFPTATPGATLSNPPPNKDHIVGKGMKPGAKAEDYGVDRRPPSTHG